LFFMRSFFLFKIVLVYKCATQECFIKVETVDVQIGFQKSARFGFRFRSIAITFTT
jgi:hypothetical protein